MRAFCASNTQKYKSCRIKSAFNFKDSVTFNAFVFRFNTQNFIKQSSVYSYYLLLFTFTLHRI